MVRPLPVRKFFCMTSGTRLSTNKSVRLFLRGGCRCWLFRSLPASGQIQANRRRDNTKNKSELVPVRNMNDRGRQSQISSAQKLVRNTYTNIAGFPGSVRAGSCAGLNRGFRAALAWLTSNRRSIALSARHYLFNRRVRSPPVVLFAPVSLPL